MSSLTQRGPQKARAPLAHWRWPYWVLALGIGSLEWLIPLSWWVHGLLTLLALGTTPFWAHATWKMLRRARTETASAALSGWVWRVLFFFVLLFLSSEAAKLYLLNGLRHGDSVTNLVSGYRSFALIAFGANCSVLLIRPRPLQRLLLVVAEHTARLLALSFGAAILVGAFLLMLPLSVRDPADISAVDAVFTAASAVCVTGLVVNQIAQTYTFFGQVVLLSLIQVGGLGIMVIYGAIVALAGRRMGTRSARMMSEVIDVASLAGIRRLLWGIIGFTFLVETLGALALYYSFLAYPAVAMDPFEASAMAGSESLLWAAAFHSVSAYCNAGFSLFRGGMLPFAGNWGVCGIIMALVVTGGLGFPVCFELLGNVWSKLRGRRPARLSLHSRIVLVTSAALLIAGTLAYLALEWRHSMRTLPLSTKVLTAAFQSTISRTAGFNTLDYSKMLAATWLVTCVLMFVGASPGSTGGGIKTTTLAVLLAATWNDLRGRPRTELWRRSVGEGAARRAVGVTLVFCVMIVLTTFLLLLTEPFEALRLGFETVSALATVGLSTGITAELSPTGKLIIATAMFLGRIGPLTLALAFTPSQESRAVTLPEERIAIG